MNIKFYDFLKSINAFTGAETKNHNTFFTYSTLFALQKISIINYKMIKIQLRFLLILLHNLLLKKNELTLSNFDRYFSDLLDLTNLNAYLPFNIASRWFFASSSNFPVACLSDRFLYQQIFSALLKPFILFNIGNLEHYRPNHFVSKNRLVLFSSVNTDARVADFQYYFTLNTASRSLMNFVIQFFFNIIKKILYLDMVFSHNNLLRYRYWFGVYHMFNKRYVRRAVVMSGLLSRGLLIYCTQKLHKSYSKLTLFNFYCSHFPAVLVKDSAIIKSASYDLKFGHDTRFLKKLRFSKFRRFFRRHPRYSFSQIRLNPLRFYFMELFRRRLQVKRYVRLITTSYTRYIHKEKRTNWLLKHANRFFLSLPVAQYRYYRRILNRVFLQDRFRPLRSIREYTRFAYIKLFFKKLKKLRRRSRLTKQRTVRRHSKCFFTSAIWSDYTSRYLVSSNAILNSDNRVLPYPYFSTYFKKNSKWVYRKFFLKKQLQNRLNFNFDSRQIWFRFFVLTTKRLRLIRVVKRTKKYRFKQALIKLKVSKEIKKIHEKTISKNKKRFKI